METEELKIRGTEVNYFAVCPRKLWLFSKQLTMERESDRVLLGKLLHEESYARYKTREVLLENLVKVDLVGEGEVLEVKLSDALEEAHRLQLLYYLFFLKKKLGLEVKGVLSVPRKMKREEVFLTKEEEKRLEDLLKEVERVKKLPKPPPAQKKPYCSKCAYYELCFV